MTDPRQTAMDDQLRAASAEANARLRHAGRRHHMRYTEQPRNPAWLTQILQRHAIAMLTGHARLCPHLTAAPSIAYAFAWAPGLLVCPACPHLATPTGAENTTCDRCRQPAEAIRPGIAQFGPLLLCYGLCRNCHTAST